MYFLYNIKSIHFDNGKIYLHRSKKNIEEDKYVFFNKNG